MSEDDYVRIISGSKICLGFVSSLNRDQFNGRTFEIPACGGFFLAERTAKHLELYKEGVEAEFFSNIEECSEKIRYYLDHPIQRNEIAARGYRRAIDSDYTCRRQIAGAIETIRAIAELKSLSSRTSVSRAGTDVSQSE